MRSLRICLICCDLRKKDFPLYNTQYIDELLSILIFALAFWTDISKYLEFNVSNSLKKYILKGIIYSNHDHFTIKLVDENLIVWHHNGQVTQSICQQEQSLMNFDDIVPLKFYGQYKAIMVFYAKFNLNHISFSTKKKQNLHAVFAHLLQVQFVTVY